MRVVIIWAGLALMILALSLDIAREKHVDRMLYWMLFLGALTGGLAKRKGFSFVAWFTSGAACALLGPGLVMSLRLAMLRDGPPLLHVALPQLAGMLPLLVLAALPFAKGYYDDDYTVRPGAKAPVDGAFAVIGLLAWAFLTYFVLHNGL